MRGTWSRALGLLLLGSLLLGAAGAGDVGGVDAALLAGLLGTLLCAWGSAHGARSATAATAARPALAARAHHRALARRAVPRQRDPDAAGHIRSRAPSGLIPAA